MGRPPAQKVEGSGAPGRPRLSILSPAPIVGSGAGRAAGPPHLGGLRLHRRPRRSPAIPAAAANLPPAAGVPPLVETEGPASAPEQPTAGPVAPAARLGPRWPPRPRKSASCWWPPPLPPRIRPGPWCRSSKRTTLGLGWSPGATQARPGIRSRWARHRGQGRRGPGPAPANQGKDHSQGHENDRQDLTTNPDIPRPGGRPDERPGADHRSPRLSPAPGQGAGHLRPGGPPAAGGLGPHLRL